MNKLINSVDDVVINPPAGGAAALRGRARQPRSAPVAVLTGRAGVLEVRAYRTRRAR